MLSNILTKQSGSALHDSQVHVFDAVGHPIYHHNRNGKILEKCEVGAGAIQRYDTFTFIFSFMVRDMSNPSLRTNIVLSFTYVHMHNRTHHWSPLKDEVAFISTSRDHDLASFDCAKDRHIFPWVDVNAQIGRAHV